jgi:cilia- and flagella-associated protein 52
MENEISQITRRNQADTLNKDFELSHIMGLNSKIPHPVQSHPTMNEVILYSVGGIVIAEDLSEKNNQVFLRHGNREISCFKVSNTGRFLAVGFTRGSENFDKKLPVSIILWDYHTKQIIYELTGLNKAINSIDFSRDDKFISALSEENSFYIWDVETGFKCYSRVNEDRIHLIYWTAIFISNENSTGRPEYTITITGVNGLIYLHLFFELKSMQYHSRQKKFTLPSNGLVRNFTCALYDEKFNSLYLGTTGGEICVFSMDNLIFKISFNAINNGITSILKIQNNNFEDCLIVGGGDGRIKILTREGHNANNLRHINSNEIQFNSKISSLNLTADSKEIICSLVNGYIYRILTNDLSYTLHSISHTISVNDVCFMNRPISTKLNKNNSPSTLLNDKCITVDDLGNVYLWDLNDFNIKGIYENDSAARSLTWGDDGKFLQI